MHICTSCFHSNCYMVPKFDKQYTNGIFVFIIKSWSQIVTKPAWSRHMRTSPCMLRRKVNHLLVKSKAGEGSAVNVTSTCLDCQTTPYVSLTYRFKTSWQWVGLCGTSFTGQSHRLHGPSRAFIFSYHHWVCSSFCRSMSTSSPSVGSLWRCGGSVDAGGLWPSFMSFDLRDKLQLNLRGHEHVLS